jgi:hypothetical protein
MPITQTSSFNERLGPGWSVGFGLLLLQFVGVCAEPPPEHTARMATEKLRLVIADNEPFAPDHRAGYSGVADLHLATEGSPNLFVPLYAGLNYEHIFSGDTNSYDWNIFAPRRAPMQLVQVATNRVELRQERTEHWPLRSRLIYEAKDDAIDLTFRATPLADLWQKHGYIGIFFASYQRDYAVGREFSFRVRAVYRKFTSVEDVVKLYEAWSGERVKRPE